MLTFTAVTLLIGDPFYEKISELVEERYGGVPGAVEVVVVAVAAPQPGRLAAADRRCRAVRHPAVRARLHPGGRADRGAGARRRGRRLGARASS